MLLYSPVNALIISLRGQEKHLLVFALIFFFCHHFMCIPGYILITVEGLQKINLERAYCILPGEVIA